MPVLMLPDAGWQHAEEAVTITSCTVQSEEARDSTSCHCVIKIHSAATQLVIALMKATV